MIERAIAQHPDAACRRRAIAAAHAWRGEMIGEFARAEADVSEALLAMGCAGNDLLVGKRMARLAAAVSPGGSRARQGGHVRGALASFQRYDELRHALCHGRAQVTLDRVGIGQGIGRADR